MLKYESLFLKFFDLGIELVAHKLTPKQYSMDLLMSTVKLVIDHRFSIGSFIFCYGLNEIETDYEGINFADIVCKVRSGIQFLLDEFYGVDEEMNRFLDELKEGDVEMFDDRINLWFSNGMQPVDLRNEKCYPIVPKHHWWWFNLTFF